MHIKKFLGAGVLALYLLYLLFSTKFVTRVFFQTPLQEIDFNALTSTQMLGRYDFNQEYIGGIADAYQTNGWAYCDSDAPEQGKFVSVVFRNPMSSYAAISTTAWSSENLIVFGEDSDRTFRYRHNTSLIDLPDGTYDLYLYCEENEQDTMLVNLHKRMKRKGRTFIQTAESPCVNKMPITVQQNRGIRMDIKTTLEQRDELLCSQGWIFLKGTSSLHQNVYICICSEGEKTFYWAQSIERKDVVNAFDDPDYAQSGFRFAIPAEHYADKEFSVEVIVEIDGIYYTNGNAYNVKIAPKNETAQEY